MRRKLWFMIPIGLAAIAAFVFIGGTLVQSLWNWLMPVLFGVREVTFWQAVGILALSRILFGGFGGGGHRSSGRWGRNMSADDRERLRQRMRERCGVGPDYSKSTAE
jgi:hypothetical protein